MKKREVMRPLNPPPPEPEEVVEQEPKDLEEDDIFDLPKRNDPVADVTEKLETTTIEEPRVQNTPTNKPKRDYSHLTKAREKSLETRRRKKEEKAKLDTDAQAYKERMEYERLCQKFGKQPVPQVVSKPEPPPPVEQVRDPEPYQHKGSANSEAYTEKSVIDYDRIVNGVTQSLTKNEQYFREMEMKIREDERKKSTEQMRVWQQDQHRKQQTQQAYSILSGSHKRNQVFDRTKSLRDSYTARYKNNWY